MNKLKLMYDLIDTMRAKEVLTGTLKVEGHEDQAKEFSIINKFEKNLVNGQIKAKIKIELDYQGDHLIEENGTDLAQYGEFKPKSYNVNQNQLIKEKLARWAFLFQSLNDIQIDQLEDQNQLLSLKISEISPCVKALIWEKMKRKVKLRRDCYHSLMKKFMTMEPTYIELTILVNKYQEMEKMLILVDGEQNKKELSLIIEVLFT